MSAPKMFAFQVLSVALVIFGTGFADISFEEVKFNNFGAERSEIESNVIDSVKSVADFIAENDIKNGIEPSSAVFESAVKQMIRIATNLQSVLAEDSEWTKSLLKTVAHEKEHEFVENDVRYMDVQIKSICEKIPLLIENPIERKMNIASIHISLHTMISSFSHRDTLLKKYPLIGAPPLIELALLVALFTPLSKTLFPDESRNPDISCKIRDTLSNYRLRTVDARLDKIHTSPPTERLDEFLTKVFTKPFDSNGYSESNSLVCEKENGIIKLTDEFSSDEIHAKDSVMCIESYGHLVRQRTEQLFPTELLSKLCDEEKPKTPTGHLFLPFVHSFSI